ncbi:MAG: 30S ribosomal protein S8 [Deltaproteobacteria bacterium]|nr:30S ribosomal protein S8 [Deltaproteobacteria bacterium]
MKTDPIADFLTHIRNAIHARKDRVDTPWSRLKESLAKVLQEEGFIGEFGFLEEGSRKHLRLWIRYDAKGQSIVRGLKRISRPGRRVYVNTELIPSVQNGLGINVLSTSRGLMVDRQARKLHVGGEVLCSVW